MVKRVLRVCKQLGWIEQYARRMYDEGEFRTRAEAFVKCVLSY